MKLILILRTLLLLLCIFVTLTGCSLTSKKTIDSSSINSNNIENLNKLLLKQKYEVSKNKDNKIIYLISLDEEEINCDKYKIEDNETLAFNVAKNKELIISMPSGKNTLYSWKIDNEVDESLIDLKTLGWIKPFKFANIIYHQDKYRQNFHIKTLRSGKQTVKLTYLSKKEKSITFNVEINFEVQ